jgi:hypothetical protein
MTRQWIVIGGLFLAGTAVAQPPQPKSAPQAIGSSLQAILEKELALTSEQQKKWATINSKYKPQLKTIDEKYKPQMDALLKQMQELRKTARTEARPLLDARRKELDAILTPEQLKKKKELDEKLRANLERRGRGQSSVRIP